MQSIIQKLKTIQDSGQMPNVIEYVRFPRFKDLMPNTTITFDYPITVFIGSNGTRKSSVIKAISGCPHGESPRRFWFSTKVDPIADEDGKTLAQSIIHAYKNENNELVECLKYRVSKRGRTLDYWESSKPRAKYGMTKTPRKPIKKNVVHLDFRMLIPAFDKCFYFSGRKEVQDYIRRKSKQLRNAIDTGVIEKLRGVAQNHPPEILTAAELKYISEILGKDYTEGSYIHHKFFSGWGESVILKTAHHSYSEAFAGSGEIAVAIMVHKIERAEDGSLILLDEPEVSLHPEAQKRLKNYILNKIKNSKHQIIVSTHSPFIAEGLPPEAIKVFRLIPSTGQTEVIERIRPIEAFSVIGYAPTASSKKILWVEDILSQKIIERVIQQFDSTAQSIFEVRLAGNSAQMYKDLAHECWKTPNANVYYLFDGDMRPNLPTGTPLTSRGLCNYTALTFGNASDLIFLRNVISNQSNNMNVGTLNLIVPPTDVESIERHKNYIEFMAERAFYLPKNKPEEIIWSNDYARSNLEISGLSKHEIDILMTTIDAETDAKKKFDLLCQKLYGGNAQAPSILSEQTKFLTRFINENNADLTLIKSIIEEIRHHN
jgi:predicted ATPase